MEKSQFLAILVLTMATAASRVVSAGPATRVASGPLIPHSSMKSHDPVEGTSGWSVDGVPLEESTIVTTVQLKKLEGRTVEVVYHPTERGSSCGRWEFYPPDRKPFIEQGPPGFDPYVEVMQGPTRVAYARWYGFHSARSQVLSIREVAPGASSGELQQQSR